METIDEYFERIAQELGGGISINKGIYGGAPCVTDTRVPVYAILEMVEEGYGHKQILKAFPSIGADDLSAALKFAAAVMER